AARWAGHALSLAGVIWLLVLWPKPHILAEANASHFPELGMQVIPRDYAVADALRDRLPSDVSVLACGTIAWMLPTMLDAPRAHLPRENMTMLVARAPWASLEDARRRLYARRYVSGDAPFRPERLR